MAELPPSLSAFVSSVADMFPPIYDTKFVAEFLFRESVSYLEYLFAKKLSQIIYHL